MAQIIFQGTGADIKGKEILLVPKDDKECIFCISGSGYSNTPSKIVGVKVLINGTFVASCSIFCHEINKHRAFATGLGTFTMPFVFPTGELGVPEFDTDGTIYPEPVKITFEMLNENSVMDVNDPISVVML